MRLTEVLRALEQSQSVYRREFCAFANERLTNDYYRELNELNEFRFLKNTDETLDGVFALTFANEHLRPCVQQLAILAEYIQETPLTGVQLPFKL